VSRPVAIIDYGMGNLDSVARAVEECGGSPLVTREPADIIAASYLVLPGVGSFAKGAANLRAFELDHVLTQQVQKGVPLLGICLGMQLLATQGSEGGETNGLGWIDGTVTRLNAQAGERVPHVGWNDISIVRSNLLLDSTLSGRDFYFVHSYAFQPARAEDVIATASYCGTFAAAVARENVFGVQFHPEKSQRAGFDVLRRFLTV
jgi:imidazole glycerol-phosphate synthase subunit HisH